MRLQSNTHWAIKGQAFFSALLTIFYIINAWFVCNSLDALYDFGSFIAAGELSKSGENPYSDQSPLIFSVYFPTINHEGIAPNLNPPISVLAFEFITDIPSEKSIAIWRIVSSFLFMIAIFLLQRFSNPPLNPGNIWRIFWAFGMAGIWHTIQLGQIYALMFILAVAAWILLKRNEPILGGIAIGMLISIKPNFIFWAIALMAVRNWAAFWASVFTAAGISAIPLLYRGSDLYLQWLEASARYTPDLLIFPANNSIPGLAARFNLPQAGYIAGMVLAALILIHIVNQKPSIEMSNALGILTSLLISPIAWTGYTLLVAPIFFERSEWNWQYWTSAFIFIVPFFIPLILFQTSYLNFVIFGWFYGWGLLVLLSALLLTRI